MVAGLLAEYALGALSQPVSVLVETHLELSGRGDRWLRDIDAVGDAMRQSSPRHPEHVLDTIDPVAFADRDASFAAVMAAIAKGGDEAARQGLDTPMARPQGRPADRAVHGAVGARSLEGFIGMKVADVPWKKVMPGLAEYRLPDVDGCEVSLLRIEGGRAMPVHTHHGSEITVVVQGGFSDDNGHYGVGDIAYADDEVNHKPIADAGEVCICFAVVDAPVRLTGPLGRLVNPFRR